MSDSPKTVQISDLTLDNSEHKLPVLSGRQRRSLQGKQSAAMSEILQGPGSQTQPIPSHKRVKQSALDILKRDNTCYWIQYMTGNQVGPLDLHGESLVSENKTDQSPPIPLEPLAENDPGMETNVGDRPIPGTETQIATGYSEQLKVLQEQQAHLQEQQYLLLAKLEQQRKEMEQRKYDEHGYEEPAGAGGGSSNCGSGGGRSDSDEQHSMMMMNELSTSKSMDGCGMPMKESPSHHPLRFRRRLKGNLAQSCALKSEGTIGALIWNGNPLEEPTSHKHSDVATNDKGGLDTGMTSRESSLSTMHPGRQASSLMGSDSSSLFPCESQLRHQLHQQQQQQQQLEQQQPPLQGEHEETEESQEEC